MGCDWNGTVFESIGRALEAVAADEQAREFGSWQDDMIPQALANLREIIEHYRPIPVSERWPEENEPVLALWSLGEYGPKWCESSWRWRGRVHKRREWHGLDMRFMFCSRKNPAATEPTHWLRLPPPVIQ